MLTYHISIQLWETWDLDASDQYRNIVSSILDNEDKRPVDNYVLLDAKACNERYNLNTCCSCTFGPFFIDFYNSFMKYFANSNGTPTNNFVKFGICLEPEDP